MRVRDVWLGFKRPRSCRAFSCMKSWSLVPPQATVFQALVIWEEARGFAIQARAACSQRTLVSLAGRLGDSSTTLPLEAAASGIPRK